MNALCIVLGVVVVVLGIFEKGNTGKLESLRSELILNTLHVAGNKKLIENHISVPPYALKDKNVLRLTYDLHGLCLLQGEASAIMFEQGLFDTRHSVSLSDYGKNCYDGEQTVDIPLDHFVGLDMSRPITKFITKFWYPTVYFIDIKSAFAYNTKSAILGKSSTGRKNPNKKITSVSTPTVTFSPTSTPTSIPTPTPTLIIVPSSSQATPTAAFSASWAIQGVSSMKETKDRVCNQRSSQFISQWVDRSVELGTNYVSIETPYDNPLCGSSLTYSKAWISAIRSNGLKVWHRHMPLAFEGIYNTPKDPTKDYLKMISYYIKNNPGDFAEGDIFTPIPEPQNGGIQGITYCPYGICQFSSAAHFNQWLRDAILASQLSFETIGLKDKVKIGYFGFDGFVAWGDNNPDWNGILEDATIQKMGNITIDHYPEIVGDTMDNDLNELEARYSNIPIVIGEWGTISGGAIEQQVLQSMGAAKRHKDVVGFNYWHLGVGGYEELVHEDLTLNIQYDEVQSFYKYSNTL